MQHVSASNFLNFYVVYKRGQNSIGVSFHREGRRRSTGLEWISTVEKGPYMS